LEREEAWGSDGVLECWSVGVLECWSVGVLECWSVGVLECWSAGVLECWSGGGLECWRAGVLEPRRSREYRHLGLQAGDFLKSRMRVVALVFGPKGQESLAQGLPWEMRSNETSPEGADRSSGCF
jgi:hypothetical protein